MARWKAKKWCGVSYCPNETAGKGLCATHIKEYKKHKLHADVVADVEIIRAFLQRPRLNMRMLHKQHRLFAQSLPIPKSQQLRLTKALNATARRRGVVK